MKKESKIPIRIKPDSELAKAITKSMENKRLIKRYLSREITFEEYKELGGKKFAKPLNLTPPSDELIPQRVINEVIEGFKEIERHKKGEIDLQDGEAFLEGLEKPKVLKIDANAFKELVVAEFLKNPEHFQYANKPKQKMLYRAFKEGRISFQEYKVFGGVLK